MTTAWPEVALGSIAEIIQGGRLKLTGNHFVPSGYPSYGAGGMNGYLPVAEFDRPAVVLSSIGARCGKCFLTETKWTSLANTQVIIPDESVTDTRFLWYLLNDETSWPRSGTAQPFIKPSDVKRRLISLPPLDEQRRIAAILDKADEVRSKRKAALETLETLSQAIFIDMFGDPVANPMGWPTESLSVITSKIGSGATPRGGDSAYKDHGIPLIRSLNIHDGRFLRRKLAFLDSEQAAKLDNVIVEENDVLLNITGASVARVCTVPNWVVPARVNQHVAIIRCEPVLSHCFLQAHLQSKSYKSLLLTMAESGATRQALTKGQIGSLKIMLPPRNLQASFESAIESATSNFDSTLKFTVSLSQLFASLQQRAFQGLL